MPLYAFYEKKKTVYHLLQVERTKRAAWAFQREHLRARMVTFEDDRCLPADSIQAEDFEAECPDCGGPAHVTKVSGCAGCEVSVADYLEAAKLGSTAVNELLQWLFWRVEELENVVGKLEGEIEGIHTWQRTRE